MIFLSPYLELTIPNVVNSISHVTEWQVLGTHLGLDNNDIKVIAANYDAKEHHQRMVETWFARDANRSWDKLQDAMKRTGMYYSKLSNMGHNIQV